MPELAPASQGIPRRRLLLGLRFKTWPDPQRPPPAQAHPRSTRTYKDLAHQVHQAFDARLDPRAIDECLAKVAARFADARVRSFVPLLVRRYVRDDLQARL